MSAPAIISSGTAAGGPPVGGSGTTDTIPRWTGPTTLGDSGLIDNGTAIYTTARNAAFGSTSSAGYRARVLAAAGAGSAFGLRIDAGTNSTDYALRIANQATTSDYLAVRGDGNVGIGTASPSGRLDVQDTTNLCRLQVASASVTNRYHANIHHFLNNTSVGGVLATIQDGVGIRLSTIYSSLVFDAATTGQGLKLAATPGSTDSQTLDCYQDGGALNSGGVTWTPTVAVGGSTTGVTYDVQVGRYTRIGNTIVAHGYVKLTSNGTGTGAVTIGGLPTSSNTANVFGSGSIGFYANITTTGQLCLRINPNSTSLVLMQTTPAGVATAITDTQFADTGEILFTISYPAT